MRLHIWDRFIHDSVMTPNEIREILGMGSIPYRDDYFAEYSDNHITNCKNCGAPLPKNGCCEYCRTQY